MKTGTSREPHLLLAIPFLLFLAVLSVVFISHWNLEREQDKDLSIVEAARQQALAVMPSYKDNAQRENFWVMTGSLTYRLEKKNTDEADVWFLIPGDSSYLRVGMVRVGQGNWSARNAKMFINPKLNQSHRNPNKQHPEPQNSQPSVTTPAVS